MIGQASSDAVARPAACTRRCVRTHQFADLRAYRSAARPRSLTKYRPDNGFVECTRVLNATGADAESAGRTTPADDRWGRTTGSLGHAGTVATVPQVTHPVTGQITWNPTLVVADRPWLPWPTVNDVAGRPS